MLSLLLVGYGIGIACSVGVALWLHENGMEFETAITVGLLCALFGPAVTVVVVTLGMYMLFRILRVGFKDLWSMRPWREKIPKARVL